MDNGCQKELFSSLVSDIKNYTGADPLRPWIQGIRKMEESLPPQILKEKLPRFLQKCVESFESDRCYRNDSRYLRVWIQLMDYVDDARVLLRKMERNHIGLKKAMFYSAYALYYEKRKKFEDAEKMYRLGVQKLAEPADELQESYNQFLHRMKLLKKRKFKLQEAMPRDVRSSTLPFQQGEDSEISHSVTDSGEQGNATKSLDLKKSNSTNPNVVKVDPGSKVTKKLSEQEGKVNMHKTNPFSGDDTVVVKFVGSAIVGKSEAEDACHHGLVDPTVNMKEAMNAISSMFREPLEAEPIGRRRSKQSKHKAGEESNVFEVYVEGSSEERLNTKHRKVSSSNSLKENTKTELQKPFVGAFKIWTDGDDEDDDDDKENHNRDLEIIEHMREDKPRPFGSKIIRSEDVRLREDTVIRRFMGSNVLGEPKVENACHNGLVDPTVNLKEAMDDINSMFGEPLNFVRASRPKKQANKQLEPKPVSQDFTIFVDDDLEEDSSCSRPKKQDKKQLEEKPVIQGFSILADDDLEEDSRCSRPKKQANKQLELKPVSRCFSFSADDDSKEDSRCQITKSKSSNIRDGSGLFEPTINTKEVMANINEMFGKPLDF